MTAQLRTPPETPRSSQLYDIGGLDAGLLCRETLVSQTAVRLIVEVFPRLSNKEK